LISYKPRWGLTLQGWLVILLFLAGLIIFTLVNLQPFLAYSNPVKADALVVEGWIGDDALKGAIAEFAQNDYQVLITTGVPLARGEYLSEYKNFAQLSAATLISFGFNREKLLIIPTPQTKKDRTLTSALAVQQWLKNSPLKIKAINVYSYDVHSRRSWLLYQQVFAPDIQVGAIAYPAVDYDPKSWWSFSQGVRVVISEAIAYFYAQFSFFLEMR
jgi:hypothetical protein